MRRLLSAYRRNESGSTAVEFALVVIPFLLLIFGVVEAGRTVWTMNGIRYAIEETSRYASINAGALPEVLDEYAGAQLEKMMIDPDLLNVTTATWTSSGADFIEVKGSYRYATFFSALLPGGFGIVDFETMARKPVLN